MHNTVMQVFLATLGQVEEVAEEPGILALIFEADIIVQAVLLILLAMSVGCWIIIFNKVALLRRAEQRSASFLETFWNSRKLEDVYDDLITTP